MDKYTNQIKKINGSEVISPPQSVEIEEIVLGALMLDKDLVNKIIDVLNIKDFYRPQNQIIFKTILDLFNRHEAVDVLTVTNLLKINNEFENAGGATHLTYLVSKVPATFYIDEYIKIIKTKSKLRALLSASYTIGRYALDESQEIDVVLDLCEKEIFQISKDSISDNFTSVSQELDKAFERIDTLKNSDESLRGLSTGFNCLDNLLGGMQKSDMIVLGARPSVGKTSLALDIVRRSAIKTHKPVALFSLEMSKDQLVDRLLAAQSGIDLWKIRTGKLQDHDFTSLRDSMEILSKAPIFIDDSPGLSMLKIRTKSRRLMAEHGLSMIVIDYLQLIIPTIQTPNSVQQFSDISRQVKGLARELDIPVLVLSQLSRSVEQRGSNAKPKLSDLRETGCLAGDTKILNADTGMFVTIKELAEREVQDSFIVYTMDENYKIIKKPLIKAFYSGKKQIYELILKSGRKIKASGNHPFRNIEGWCALDDLCVGDKISTPREIKINSHNLIIKEELILLAHLLGDGCVLNKQPIHYTSADLANIKIVNKCAKKLFNIQGRVVPQNNWYHTYLTSPYRLGHNKKHPIIKWYESLEILPVRSYEKIIPKVIFSLNKDQIAIFIKHLFATDGNISISKKNNVAIYYASTSYVLIEQLQHLLLRFGIQSSIRKKQKESYRPCYDLVIQGKVNQLKYLKEIGCFGDRAKIIPRAIKILNQLVSNPNLDIIPKEAWKYIVCPAKELVGMSWRGISALMNTRYCGSCLFKSGISRERLSRLDVLDNMELNNVINSDIYWDEIKEIKKLNIEDVYDATIQDTHNFLANDIIVHNSIEQDADVVMLLNRKVSDVQSPDGENNFYVCINVAKHRNGPIGERDLFFVKETASFAEIDKSREDFDPDYIPEMGPEELS